MKISIIGSGAMGCLFGALLFDKNDVTIIGRNKATVDCINNNGIEITERDNSVKKFYPKAVLNGLKSDSSDLVIIMVKTYDTFSALENNRKLINNSKFILTLQNGLGNEDLLFKFAKKEKILIGTTEHNSSVNDNAKIYHGGNGSTVIGGLSENSEILNQIVSTFSDCGIITEISDNVQKVIWKKLFLNIGVNALTAVLDIPTGFLIKGNNITEIYCGLIKEAIEIAKIYNLEFDYSDILNSIINLAIRQPDAHTSMYIDIKNKRKTEIDSINGAIVRIAEKNNINVPYNKMITNMIHTLELKGMDI